MQFADALMSPIHSALFTIRCTRRLHTVTGLNFCLLGRCTAPGAGTVQLGFKTLIRMVQVCVAVWLVPFLIIVCQRMFRSQVFNSKTEPRVFRTIFDFEALGAPLRSVDNQKAFLRGPLGHLLKILTNSNRQT